MQSVVYAGLLASSIVKTLLSESDFAFWACLVASLIHTLCLLLSAFSRTTWLIGRVFVFLCAGVVTLADAAFLLGARSISTDDWRFVADPLLASLLFALSVDYNNDADHLSCYWLPSLFFLVNIDTAKSNLDDIHLFVYIAPHVCFLVFLFFYTYYHRFTDKKKKKPNAHQPPDRV